MNKFFLIFPILIFLFACGGDNIKDRDPSSIPQKNIEKDSTKSQSNLDNISEIDKRIAVALVKDINDTDPKLYIDRYEAYYNNRELYLNIINKEFADQVQVDSVQIILDNYLNEVISRTRNVVLDDYGKYNSLEGRYFAFLYLVKDSSVNRILKEIQNNPFADSLEIQRLSVNYPPIKDENSDNK